MGTGPSRLTLAPFVPTIPRLMPRPRSRRQTADAPPVESQPVKPTAVDRWWGKLLLVLLAVGLLTAAVTPVSQFYAAWIGLVPLLMAVRHSRTLLRAAAWGWLAGTLFFAVNMWWLVLITDAGVVALVAVLGLYWAGAAAVLWPVLRARDGGLVPATGDGPPTFVPALARPRAAVAFLFLLPIVWVGFEWLHGTWPFEGLPWLYLGHTQTPILPMCQIADITGELGVSFWVAMVNALALLFLVNGWRLGGLAKPVAVTGTATAVVLAYGLWRFAQTPGVTSPGPTVLVVQPNFPQKNTGDKGAGPEEMIDFHVGRTNAAMSRAMTASAKSDAAGVDLVVWSETMMPALNAEALDEGAEITRIVARRNALIERIRDAFFVPTRRWPTVLAGPLQGILVSPPPLEFFDYSGYADRLLRGLAERYRVALLVGGRYTPETLFATKPPLERNSAYFLDRAGRQVGRYDKIHLVPFGEYIPFKEAWPWLYRQMIALGPPNMEGYQLQAGTDPKVFELAKNRLQASPDPAAAWRFVTPICFEDIVGDHVASLIRGGAPRGSLTGGKRADLIVNVTNDGWFAGGQQYQHLQCATFRSIENRVPTARSVNTGISGFIDSLGRTPAGSLIARGTEGTLAMQVMVDSRTTFFTQWGNLIGPGCGIGAGMIAMSGIARRLRRRRP